MILAIVMAWAVWFARDTIAKQKAEEAVRLKPPTVIAPAASDGALAYRYQS